MSRDIIFQSKAAARLPGLSVQREFNDRGEIEIEVARGALPVFLYFFFHFVPRGTLSVYFAFVCFLIGDSLCSPFFLQFSRSRSERVAHFYIDDTKDWQQRSRRGIILKPVLEIKILQFNLYITDFSIS